MAYADFVTAMMALFMVLWISAQDEKILIATSKYFQNPFHSPMQATSGVLPFNSNKTSQSQGKESGSEKEQERNKAVKSELKTAIRATHKAVAAGDKDTAATALVLAGKKLDKAVSKGVIHKNQAANRKSAIAKQVAAL